jgi:hypothetical protein
VNFIDVIESITRDVESITQKWRVIIGSKSNDVRVIINESIIS